MCNFNVFVLTGYCQLLEEEVWSELKVLQEMALTKELPSRSNDTMKDNSPSSNLNQLDMERSKKRKRTYEFVSTEFVSLLPSSEDLVCFNTFLWFK